MFIQHNGHIYKGILQLGDKISITRCMSRTTIYPKIIPSLNQSSKGTPMVTACQHK